MSGSTFGQLFKISSWGESHGHAVGVVVDGCPSGLLLSEQDIQQFLDRRKPGQNQFATPRKEDDLVQILSGVFEGKTTGTPISMIVYNSNQKSKDYSALADIYRPGHADFTFDAKYGFRDYRGGGRSSGRETIARVAAGAIALKILSALHIEITAYTKSVGPVHIDYSRFNKALISENALSMPDPIACQEAEDYLTTLMSEHNSSGGVIECVITGLMPGIGEPVFEKLDANLAKAIMSIGGVKGFEIGKGFDAAKMTGLEHNDHYFAEQGQMGKMSNHAGGILGGISDGSTILWRAAIKPTPSIFATQKSVNRQGENIELNIKGRHDPIIVPRAVVVSEAMTALTIVDMLFISMTSRMDNLITFFS